MKKILVGLLAVVMVLGLTAGMASATQWWYYNPGTHGVQPGPHSSTITKYVTATVPEYFTVKVISDKFTPNNTLNFGTMLPGSSKEIDNVFNLEIYANVPWQLKAVNWGSFAGQYRGAGNWQAVPSGYKYYNVNLDDAFKVRFREYPNKNWVQNENAWRTATGTFLIARPPLHYGTAYPPGMYYYNDGRKWRLYDPTQGYRIYQDFYLSVSWHNLPANYQKTVHYQITWHL